MLLGYGGSGPVQQYSVEGELNLLWQQFNLVARIQHTSAAVDQSSRQADYRDELAAVVVRSADSRCTNTSYPAARP